METIDIKLKRAESGFEDIELPHYATDGSSGLDIRAAVKSDLKIAPGEIAMVPTNLIVEIPIGYEIQVRPRSGLAAKHGVTVLNTPGTIDSDYRGEIKIILINFGKEPFTIIRGDRIAQLVISKVYKGNLVLTDNLKDSKRGDGGFGHTGK